jgi:hypothetical protein
MKRLFEEALEGIVGGKEIREGILSEGCHHSSEFPVSF